MALYQPAWLLFLIPLAAAWLLWPLPTRVLRALRAATFVLLVLALCQPVLRLPDRSGAVVVIADRSESMPPQSFTAQKEIIDLVQSTMRPRDRLAVVAFAKKAAVEHPPQTGKFAGFLSDVGKDQSHLASALETALALVPEEGVGRVLVLSDGRHTGRNPAELVPRFAARGIALDFRLFQRSSAQDVAVYRVQAPESVAPKQAFMLTAWVRSPVSQEIAYELRCGSHVLAAGKKAVSAGLSRLMFRDRADEPGVRSYTLAVAGSGQDPVPENNAAKLLVGVRGRRPVLCVTAAGSRSGFARALKEGGVEVRPPGECRWAMEDLAQYAAVAVENTLANAIGSEGMENLAAWVQSAAGGFMMTGGKLSYGPGGYFKSPLERILPISMELRQEHRKLSVAIVIAMDRSGSMQMPAGGGKRKMDLADLGAAEVLDMLSPVDEIGVIAVDSQAHVIVDLDTVDRNRAYRDTILRIDSMGGGIFIY
ncbi:MAG: VWA domain-containing protein, partial [Planctomycetes bacterium]|nr:VWA domain-containing protein [Planctomycetota bacterium]